MCYKTGNKGFIGNNRCVEGTDASGTESCFNVCWCGCCFPCYSENLARSRHVKCGTCALVRTAHPVLPSNAQMVHRHIYPKVAIHGHLAWKVGQCSMAVCSSTLVLCRCDFVSSNTNKQGPYNDCSWRYCVKQRSRVALCCRSSHCIAFYFHLPLKCFFLHLLIV